MSSPAVSQRIAAIYSGHVVTVAERKRIAAAEDTAEQWSDLPDAIRRLLAEIETRPDVDEVYDGLVASGPAAFHLPGQHDQRTHGRRVGGLEGSATADRASRWHQDLTGVEDLVRSIDSGVDTEQPLSGGNFGIVARVTLKDGRVMVRKRMDPASIEETFGPGGPYTSERQADAEQAVGMIGAAIGAPVPRVVRTEKDEVWIELAPGTTWAEFSTHPAIKKSTLNDVFEEVSVTDGGYRLGLLDLLTDSWDRKGAGNWLLQDDGSPAGIDHSFSFPEEKIGSVMDGYEVPTREYLSPFSIVYLQFDDAGNVVDFDGADIAADDVAWLKDRLRALENDFDVIDRHDWWQFAMDRLAGLADVAAGTTRRFGVE